VPGGTMVTDELAAVARYRVGDRPEPAGGRAALRCFEHPPPQSVRVDDKHPRCHPRAARSSAGCPPPTRAGRRGAKRRAPRCRSRLATSSDHGPFQADEAGAGRPRSFERLELQYLRRAGPDSKALGARHAAEKASRQICRPHIITSLVHPHVLLWVPKAGAVPARIAGSPPGTRIAGEGAAKTPVVSKDSAIRCIPRSRRSVDLIRSFFLFPHPFRGWRTAVSQRSERTVPFSDVPGADGSVRQSRPASSAARS